MQNVVVNFPLVHPPSSRDWTAERRERAAANVQSFLLEFATDPTLPTVALRVLRVMYPLHYDPQTVRAIIWCAQQRGWNREAVREVVKGIMATRFVRHCRGFDNRCWLHNPIVVHDRTTGGVAGIDAKGVVHVTD
jgi:hypothetical protein